jgi:hypothetical protein
MYFKGIPRRNRHYAFLPVIREHCSFKDTCNVSRLTATQDTLWTTQTARKQRDKHGSPSDTDRYMRYACKTSRAKVLPTPEHHPNTADIGGHGWTLWRPANVSCQPSAKMLQNGIMGRLILKKVYYCKPFWMEMISRKIDDIELTFLRQQIQFCMTLSLLQIYFIIINFS